MVSGRPSNPSCAGQRRGVAVSGKLAVALVGEGRLSLGSRYDPLRAAVSDSPCGVQYEYSRQYKYLCCMYSTGSSQRSESRHAQLT